MVYQALLKLIAIFGMASVASAGVNFFDLRLYEVRALGSAQRDILLEDLGFGRY